MRRRRRAQSVDAYVGGRVRVFRTLAGMSQTQLGKSVGITFQQVQKYERGENRISASRLYEFGRVLGVPVSYFFEGAGQPRAKTASAEDGQLIRRATLQFLRAYYAIPPAARKAVFDLVKSAAREGALSGRSK